MPSLRERLQAQRWSDIAPRNWFAIDGDMIDEIDAVLAAAEALAKESTLMQQMDGTWVQAVPLAALLTLFPPPEATKD